MHLSKFFEQKRGANMDSEDKKFDRRQVMRTVLIGGVLATIMMPSKWTKPLVNSVIVPAHAAASAPATTTAAPTTTPTPTTTVTTTTTAAP
jgi:hypothetical protein